MAKANTEEVKPGEPIEDVKPGEPIEEKEETVMIRLPLDRYHKKDVFVGVNGRTWQIKRGETVEVPVYVEEVLRRQEQMENEALAYEEALQAELDNMIKGVLK